MHPVPRAGTRSRVTRSLASRRTVRTLPDKCSRNLHSVATAGDRGAGQPRPRPPKRRGPGAGTSGASPRDQAGRLVPAVAPGTLRGPGFCLHARVTGVRLLTPAPAAGSEVPASKRPAPPSPAAASPGSRPATEGGSGPGTAPASCTARRGMSQAGQRPGALTGTVSRRPKRVNARKVPDGSAPRKLRMTPEALRVLAVLAGDDPSASHRLAGLAGRTGVLHSAVTQVVTWMAAEGWLVPVPADGGARAFRLTSEGQAAVQGALDAAQAGIASARAALYPSPRAIPVPPEGQIAGPDIADALIIRAFLGTPAHPCDSRELSARTGIKGASLDRAVARVKAAGWVAGVPDPAGASARMRPSSLLTLTPAGRAAAPAVLDAARSRLAGIVGGLGGTALGPAAVTRAGSPARGRLEGAPRSGSALATRNAIRTMPAAGRTAAPAVLDAAPRSRGSNAREPELEPGL